MADVDPAREFHYTLAACGTAVLLAIAIGFSLKCPGNALWQQDRPSEWRFCSLSQWVIVLVILLYGLGVFLYSLHKLDGLLIEAARQTEDRESARRHTRELP